MIGEFTDSIEQSETPRFIISAQIELGGIKERDAHFLQLQQLGESRVHLSRDVRIALPVERSKACSHPLAGAEAVKSIAALIAEILEAIVDSAAKVLIEMVTGIAGELVVTESIRAIEPQRDAAEPDAAGAVSLKIQMVHVLLREGGEID